MTLRILNKTLKKNRTTAKNRMTKRTSQTEQDGSGSVSLLLSMYDPNCHSPTVAHHLGVIAHHLGVITHYLGVREASCIRR